MNQALVSRQTRTVLIVDDEPDILEVAGMALEMIGGWTVHTANGGQAGVDRARELLPDVILMDVMMPDVDGPAAWAQLRADPATAEIPVILLTAKVTMRDAGALAVIHKPFDPMHLSEQIDDALVRHQRPREVAVRPVASPGLAGAWRQRTFARLDQIWEERMPEAREHFELAAAVIERHDGHGISSEALTRAHDELWNVIAVAEVFSLRETTWMARKLQTALEQLHDEQHPEDIACAGQLLRDMRLELYADHPPVARDARPALTASLPRKHHSHDSIGDSCDNCGSDWRFAS